MSLYYDNLSLIYSERAKKIIYSLFTLSGTPPTIFHKGIQHAIIFIKLHIYIEPPQEVRLEAVLKIFSNN